jgi:WD40 repeat protein
MSFDPRGRYFAVGCRDKSLSLFDTSTFVKVKEFHVAGWVTSISWAPPRIAGNYTFSNGEVIAFRSDNRCISILDLTPTSLTNIRLSSQHGQESSISWSLNGTLVARAVGSMLIISDALDRYRDVMSIEVTGLVTQVRFCPVKNKENQLIAIDDSGVLTILQVSFQPNGDLATDMMRSVMIAPGLKALAWSNDGQMIATGGRDKILYLYQSENLQLQVEPMKLEGRIWDIDFIPERTKQSQLFFSE